MSLVQEHAKPGSLKELCHSLGVSRATFYRRRKGPSPPQLRPPNPRRLSQTERMAILDILCSQEFADLSPYQVHATLLQRGTYLCSIRTMYRILQENDAVQERRAQRRHPHHAKPQLIAMAPGQVWSWDITKLPGPCKGVVFCLYVLLDLFSRFVVSWTIEETESTATAKRLVRHAVKSQGVDTSKLTIHADRGAPMTSKGLYALFDSLNIRGSHSRPRVSNDNPFSEAHFKTAKYHSLFPKRFASLEMARQYFECWFNWYNHQHHHIGLALFTPLQVHDGSYRMIQVIRQQALDEAFRQHPERFVNGPPQAPTLPQLVSINLTDPAEGTASEAPILDEHPSPLRLMAPLLQDAREAPLSSQGEKS